MLNQIKKARLIAGISQIELAAKIGVTPGAVCQWENGRTRPNVRMLKPLAEALNTTVEKLLGEEERAI